MAMHTRPFSKSTAIGSSIGILIGLLWFCYGVFLIHEPYYRYSLLIFGLAITFYLFRKTRSALLEANTTAKTGSQQTKGPKNIGLFFIINTIVEIVLLNLALNYLVKIEQGPLILPAISIVVGLHFIPMAIFLRYKEFYISSVLMILSGIVLMMLSKMMTENTVSVCQSMLSASALWLTALATLRNSTD